MNKMGCGKSVKLFASKTNLKGMLKALLEKTWNPQNELRVRTKEPAILFEDDGWMEISVMNKDLKWQI